MARETTATLARQDTTVVQDTIISGSATSTVTFNNLDILNDNMYVLLTDLQMPAGLAACSLYMYFNDNVVHTDYRHARIVANSLSATPGSVSESSPAMFGSTGSEIAMAVTYIRRHNVTGKIITLTHAVEHESDLTQYTQGIRTVSSTFSLANVNKITIISKLQATSVAVNGIGINSRFVLSKLK